MHKFYLTVSEAAEFLRVSPATLYGWVHRRVIPARKHGSRLLFALSDLESWSLSNKIGGIDFDAYCGPSLNVKKRSPTKSGVRSLKTEQKEERSSQLGGD